MKQKKRMAALLLAGTMLFSVLPVEALAAAADQAAEAVNGLTLTAADEGLPERSNAAGWNENNTVYTVIGQEGYPQDVWSAKPIELPNGTILDLRQADSYIGTKYENGYLFNAMGNVTVIGSGESIGFKAGGRRRNLVQMQGSGACTLKLIDFCWDENLSVNEGIWGFFGKDCEKITVLYDGDNKLPLISFISFVREDTLSRTLNFVAADAEASLALGGIIDSTKNSSIVFDGGTIDATDAIGGVSATNITIKNGCRWNGGGKGFEGLRCQTNGYIIIENSEVNIDFAYNGGDALYSTILGGINSPTSAHKKDIGWYSQLSAGTIQSYIKIDDSTVNVNSDKWMGSGIGGVKDIQIINSSNVTVSVSYYDRTNASYPYSRYAAGIGGVFQNILIQDSTVTSEADGGAGIGTGIEGFATADWSDSELESIKGTIEIENSTVQASSIQGAGIGSGGKDYSNSTVTLPIDVTISGSSNVTARSIAGAGIGGEADATIIKNPDIVVIGPSIGGGWGDGGSDSGSIETFALRTFAFAETVAEPVPICDSEIPAAVQSNVQSAGQTLTVIGNPTILAESGVCAISSEVVNTSVTIVQNTVETSPSQTIPIMVGDVKLGNLREGFTSIARTAPAGSNDETSWEAIGAGTSYTMTYGSGSDPDPLVNNNSEAGALYQAGPYEIEANKINRFWTLPQQKLGGTAEVATSSETGTTTYQTNINTPLYAKIGKLTPKAARENATLSYQWYKDGKAIENATETSYTPKEVGLYWYVVTGSDRYRGGVTSAVVTVTESGTTGGPGMPTAKSTGKDSITLWESSNRQYGILTESGVIQWQDSNVFDGLTPNTTYNFFQRVKDVGDGKPGPASTARAITTKGDKPTEADISYNYENEWIVFSEDIIVFKKCYKYESGYWMQDKIKTNEVITEYIGKTLYACYVGVNETMAGEDEIFAFTVPARPAAPALYPENVQATTNSITILGTPGVAYNYVKAAEGTKPDATTAVICDESGKVTFGGLTPNTEYTIYARWPASNVEQRFHSDEYTIRGTTLSNTELTTKIYVPAGTAGTRSYDLSGVLGDGKIITSFAENTLGAAVSESGNTVSLTLAGSESGSVTLNAALSGNSSLTIEVNFLTDVVEEQAEANILWRWRMADDSARTAAETALNAYISEGERLAAGSAYRLAAVYASGPNAGKTAPAEPTEVLLPYWNSGNAFTSQADSWVVACQLSDGTWAKLEPPALTETEKGIQLTDAKPGVYAMYTVKPGVQKSFAFAQTAVKKTYGDASFVLEATRQAEGSTVTYSAVSLTAGKDAGDIATVDNNGNVTIVGAGTVLITATASAVEGEWKEATATYTLTVSPKELIVKAMNKTVYVGSAMPELTYEVTGLVGTDKLIKAPTLICSAKDTNTAGGYPIKASGADAGANYEITYGRGTLTVTDKKLSAITLTAEPAALAGGGTVTLTIADMLEGGSTVTVTCSDETIELIPGEKANTWTANLPNATAKYTFTAVYAGNAEYAAAQATATVTTTEKIVEPPAPEMVTYTIEHYVADATAETGYRLYHAEQHAGKAGDTVIAEPLEIEGFIYNAEKSEADGRTEAVLTADGEPVVLVLYYDALPSGLVAYTIEHYVADAAAETGYRLYHAEQHAGKAGDTVMAEPLEIEGFIYNAEKSETDGQTEAVLTADGEPVVLVLYYDALPSGLVAYNIEHYVADAASETGYRLYHAEQHAGKAGDTVTAEPLEIEGFIYNAEKSEADGRTEAVLTADGEPVMLVLYYDAEAAPTPPEPADSDGDIEAFLGAAVVIGGGTAALAYYYREALPIWKLAGVIRLAADDTAVANAVVTLLQNGEVVKTLTTDANGYFTARVPKGTYELVADWEQDGVAYTKRAEVVVDRVAGDIRVHEILLEEGEAPQEPKPAE